MSWFKLDDQFPTHPKVLRAGPDAAWLYICGGCYCAKHLTNGKIPKVAVATLSTLRSPVRLAEVLVREGLWHDAGDDYEMHDYLEFNPSRDEVENVRRQARERRAKGGKRSADVRANVLNPDPTRPDVHTEHGRARTRAVSPPKDFQPTPEHETFAQEQGLDLPGEIDRWLVDCEAKGRTYKVVNAGFTTWLHHAVDFGRGGKRPATIEELATPRLVPVPPTCPLELCNGRGFIYEDDGTGHDVAIDCPHLSNRETA